MTNIRVLLGATVALLLMAWPARAITQYWDPDPATGYQHGDGPWSTNVVDANWGVAATGPRSTWTNGNAASFGAGAPGSSRVTVSGAVTGSSFNVPGSGYTLVVTNGASVTVTGGTSGLGASTSLANALELIGGEGVVSRIEAGSQILNLKGTNNTMLVDGRGVDGSAVISNGVMNVGFGGVGDCGNGITVLNGGWLASSGASLIGAVSGATGNYVIVDHARYLFGSTLTIGFGASSEGNGLVVTNGGVATASGLTVGPGKYGLVRVNDAVLTLGSGGLSLGGVACELRAGSNAVVNSSGPITFMTGASNILSVSDGGRMAVTGSALVMRSTTSYQTIRVSGAGSLLDGGGNTYNVTYWATGVGQFGNQVIVANGGVVTNMALLMHIQNFGGPVCAGNLVAVTNGGRFYSSGLFSLNDKGSATPLICNNTALVAGASSVWDNGNYDFGTGGGSNHMVLIDGGLLTNVAALTIGGGNDNRMIVTNGGRVFSTGAATLGTVGSGNEVRMEGSLWNAGNAALTIGSGSGSNNTLTLNQGGTVDAVSTLAVVGAFNGVNLRGGTLGVANMTYTNGLFAVGDGAQAAILKMSPGGSLAFNRGLLVNANALLTGQGTVGGGEPGVTLASGSTLAPGASGVGVLTIAGSNLTLNAGSTTTVEIADMNPGPGLGWDVVNVSSQLVVNGSGLVIKMDSMGAPAAHFDSARDYNLRIVNFGSLAGYDAAAFTVDSSDFQNGGTWAVTNSANALWLVYRGVGAPPAATFTWKAPNSGTWSDSANWDGGVAPDPGGNPDWILAFPDTGVRYAASNNLAGSFLFKTLRVSSVSAVTNILAGNPLVLTNSGAGVEYAAGAVGTFIVSNAVRLATDTEFGGSGVAGTLLLAGSVTNLGTLTKRGTWTLALGSSGNSFSGPVVVDGPDGTLRLDTITSLSGPGRVTVSNGLLAVNNTQGSSYFFANNQPNRQALVSGSGSVWTNGSTVANNQSGFSIGTTNVGVLIDGGRMIWNVRFHAFNSGSMAGLAVVTNGGQLVIANYGAWIAYAATNCTMLLTGPNSMLNCFGLGLTAFDGGAAGNVFRLENGAVATNIGNMAVAAASSFSNRLVIASGGKLFSAIPTIGGVGAAFNAVTLTGTNSLWVNSGNAAYIGSGAGSHDNSLTVDNGGVATNFRLFVASGCNSNSLSVTRGGKVFGNAAYDQTIGSGPFASSNSAVVTDPGSVWNGAGRKIVISTGNTGSWNRLTIAAGGLVTNVSTVSLADGAGSSNNTLAVNGGTLVAASVAFGNLLVNTMQMEGSALVVLNTIAVTNASQALSLKGGQLTVRNAIVSNTFEFVAGDGFQPAVLDIQAGGTNFFANGLVITNHSTLTGAGLIMATSAVYGTLSPGGSGIGAITNAGGFTLKPGAATKVDLAAYTTPGAGWDCLSVTNGTLGVDGTLSVLLAGGFEPTNGQSFVILTNLSAESPAVSGSFANTPGSLVPAYTNAGGRARGSFRVVVGARSVVLDSFAPLTPNPGTFIFIR